MSKCLGGIKGCKHKKKLFVAYKRVPDGNTIGSTVYVGEKPTVILYTYINRHAGTPEKTIKTKQRKCSTPSHITVVIIYYCIGYKYKATTWYLNGFPNNGSNLGSTV